MIKIIKKYKLPIFILLIFIIKLLLVSGIPIIALGGAIHDDRLMIDNSIALLNGQWLGNYNERTLVKGVIFPLFLSVIQKLNISYTVGLSILYGFSCIIFIIAIRKFINNKNILIFIYLVMLFCPVSYSAGTFQRVYRNSISPTQIIFLIACFIGMYMNKYESIKKYLLWAIGATFAFASMWHTREDGIWIIPFTGVAILITLFCIIKKYRKNHEYLWKKVLITIMPIIIVIISINLISAINYKYYGVYTNNELLNSNFTKAYKSILSIEPEEKIDYVSVPKSTVKKLYEVSPTFNKLKPYFEDSTWDKFGHYGIDGNIEDGWFFWALREYVYTVSDKKNAKSINEFYLKIYDEVESGFDKGIFKRRKTFSSPLMTPWDNRYLKPTLKAFIEGAKYISTYNSMYATCITSEGKEDDVRLFETITGNQAINPGKCNLILDGWIFSKNESDNIQVCIVNENKETIANIILNDSNDVFQYFRDSGNEYKNAEKARFSIVENILNQPTPLYLKIKINGNEVKYINLDGKDMSNINGDIYYYFDKLEYDKNEDINTKYMSKKIIMPNKIEKIYASTGSLSSILGIIAYIMIGIKCLLSIKNKKYIFIDEFLIITGIGASLCVLLGGVAYTHATAYNAITTTYFSAGYPLLIMFWSFSIGIIVQYILNKYKR
ncbi:hypothetical protein [Clostridium sp. ZBS17]|uniref:hypothetical protein n=1 Tax=Clostridium sp. ZBS17 TaxID=2949968 RepID=UPI00207AFD8E|nr:hypothetical protein [Clostridium sp. ZBS17]